MSISIPRVAQYARFSSDNQRFESIDAQIRAMNQFCKQNYWQIVAVYSDEARSATTDNRPQFQKMIEDSGKGLFDIVLVHKLDRFSRDRYDSAIYKKKLKKNHVRLCSVLERMDDSPESIMMESVLEGMAEYYSKNLGREVMKGMKETALQCKHTGGCPPLGYDVDENRHLTINEHEAEAVKIIFEMFAEGYGYTAIIKHLNEHGYEPKRGGIFGKNSLLSILSNEKYMGVFVFNKSSPKDTDGKRNGSKLKSQDQMIRIENGCPAIISKELFYKVQKRKRENKRGSGRYHSEEFYLLTGKIFCGVCGKHIQGNVRYSGRSKLRLATYRCPTLRKFCNNKENNKDYLDAYVVELLRTEIFNSKKLRKRINAVNAYVEQYNAQYQSLFEEINNQLEKVNQSLANITTAVEKGIITQTLVDRVEELEKQRSELQTKLYNMHLLEPLKYDDFSHLITDFQNMQRGTEEFRTFVQTYIDKVVTFPYHIEVYLDVGFGVTNELTQKIKIRRGELYALFESRIKED